MPCEDNPEHALRAASWQHVRDDFDRLASKPMISLVAIVTEGDADPSPIIRELATRKNQAHWQVTPIRPVDGRPDEYELVPVPYRLSAFGEPETWEAFCLAAMRAGVLAKAVPDNLLPASVREHMSDLDRWAWALFELGWRKLDFVPFRAERWVRDCGGAIQLELARMAGLYRGWYYSEIGDAASASIDVVDVLRTMECASYARPGVESLFGAARATTERFIARHCPKAVEQLRSVEERLQQGDEESCSQALTTCRRIFLTVADAVFPAREEPHLDAWGKPRAVGPEDYKNRLLAFITEGLKARSDARLLQSELEHLAAKLDSVYDKACKGVHESVTIEEARLAVIHTYLFIAEVARVEKGEGEPRRDKAADAAR